MVRLDDILTWLLLAGLTAAGVFIAFYFMMFLLPFIVFTVIGCAIYASVRAWLRRRRMNTRSCVFEIHEKDLSSPEVIDAEFEILDEKNHK